MNKEKKKGFLMGIAVTMVCMFLLSPVSAFAKTATETISVIYQNIKIVVDGNQINPTDANGNVVEPFIYDGTTYLPVRAIGNAIGKAVSWDDATKTVYLGENTSAQAPTEAETMGQKNALAQAKKYLDFSAFSYTGLIKQLEFEGYSNEDATYAVDNCGADWFEQAAKAAKNYLEYSPFSKDGLIKQLEFEGFTNEQAVYGAQANGY